MDYSLYDLNQKAILNSLTTSDLINQLNLIGFEIDDISINKSIAYDRNIKLLVKIPANRSDLNNENVFLLELSMIFLFKLLKTWEKIKDKYFFLLRYKYNKLKNYNLFPIKSNIENVGVTLIPITIKEEKKFSPIWIQERLKNSEIKDKKNFQDLFSLVSLEWGQTFNIFSFNKKETNSFQLILEAKDEYCIFPINDIKKSQNLFPSNDSISTFLINKSKFNTIFLGSIFYYKNKKEKNINNQKLIKKLRDNIFSLNKSGIQRILTLLEIIFLTEIGNEIYQYLPTQFKINTNKILKLRKNSAIQFLNIYEYDKKIFKRNGLLLVCETLNDFYFSIPYYRDDLNRQIDIIEEYCKYMGYTNFQEIMPNIKKLETKLNKKRFELIKNFLISYGFNEVLTNPFQSYCEQNKEIEILNPLNIEFNFLRSNLVSKLINVFENNSRIVFEKRNFFEVGRVCFKKNSEIIERDHIGGIFQLERLKRLKEPTIEWFIAKGFIELFVKQFASEAFSIKTIDSSFSSFHPKRSISMLYNNNILGYFGEIDSKFETNSKYATYIFEFDLTEFKNCKKNNLAKTYSESCKYPSVIKDLSFSIQKNIQLTALENSLKRLSEFLKRLEIFDIYYEPNNNKFVNIGIRLEFQSNKQTLTNNIIDIELEKIKKFISLKFEALFKI